MVRGADGAEVVGREMELRIEGPEHIQTPLNVAEYL
jgi:hypothetical protein